ncbi:MAG TPA: glycosyltransferase family 39 protein, partial [Acidimicrobiia bacterium]|nr:glycosyltransferase family 39 protein [Acidimicrobiia bacterium]
PRRSGRWFWLALVLIALAGFGVRLYTIYGYMPTCTTVTGTCPNGEYRLWGDAFYYHTEANELADGRGFIDPFRDRYLHLTQPSAGHPPMYSVYLAAWSVLGARSITWHRFASTVLGTATILVLALLARRIAGNRAALITAALAAFLPALWANDFLLMSETIAAFAAAIALVASYEFARRPDLRRGVVLGAALGFAALSRSEIIFLFPFVAIPLTLRLVRGWREWLKTLGVIFGVGLLVMAPWIGYNLSRFDKPVFLSTGLWSTISAGSCDVAYYGAYTGWYLCGYRETPGVTNVTFVPSGQIGPMLPRTMDESQRDEVVGKYAKQYVEHHFGRLPVVVAARVGRLWYLYKPAQTAFLDGTLEGRGMGAARLARWTEYFVMSFGIAGMVVLWRRRTTIIPILGLIAASTLAAAITFGIPRYRVAADVGLVFACGIALDALWQWLRARVAPRPEDSEVVAV